MTGDKRLTSVHAVHADTELPFEGYEIHIGRTAGPDSARPFAHVDGQPEGHNPVMGVSWAATCMGCSAMMRGAVHF